MDESIGDGKNKSGIMRLFDEPLPTSPHWPAPGKYLGLLIDDPTSIYGFYYQGQIYVDKS